MRSLHVKGISMENFTFHNPTRIEFGKHKEQKIAHYLKEYGIKHVLLTYGSQRIKNDGLFDMVAKSLQEQGIAFSELGGIVSNPVLSKVYEGIEMAKSHKVDAILSVGGGSVLDSSKAIAAGALDEGDVWDFFCGKRAITQALPIFDIITLAATGSEMNCGAVLTNEKTHQKYFIQAPALYPKVSVMNPELMKSVSKEYLVYSAVDIIAHSLEGYLSATVHPMFINRQVETVIKTVIETTEMLLKNPDDYDARAQFAWASSYALNGLTYVGIAGYSYPNHMIEHALSALYNIPHGAGLSIVIPAWMKWYNTQNEAQFIRFAKEIFKKETAQEGIVALEDWFNMIGSPTRLSQCQIEASEIDKIAGNAYDNAQFFGLSKSYPKETIITILKKAV